MGALWTFRNDRPVPAVMVNSRETFFGQEILGKALRLRPTASLMRSVSTR